MNPIRVLHVVTYMDRSGLETMIMNYYRHMDRSKIQFDFLVHRAFRADYDDEIEALGGKIYRLPRLVPWSRSYRHALHGFFATHPEYKIVHVHQDCLSSIILKAAWKHGVSVRIAHSHSSSQDKNLKYLIKLYYKQFIPKFATDLFACGKEAGDWMFGGASYCILNNAIDVERYSYRADVKQQTREQLGIAQDAFVIGHVGRFFAVKNHDFLLEVFQELKKQEKNAVLLLVGDGPLRQEKERKVHELGLTESVIFTGVRSDVPELMQMMDVFVLPSLYEGIPVTLIEAQAAGLPCMVSDAVPTECEKTDLVERISLTGQKQVWVERILNHRKGTRMNRTGDIIRAGYDIRTNAAWLQHYYEEKFEEISNENGI